VSAPSVPGLELVCLDMAGTTVGDNGVVEGAFRSALDELEVSDGPERAAMTKYVRRTMGTSKIEVFRALFGSEERARSANAAFEAAYDTAVRRGDVEPLPGAEACLEALRSAGLKLALTTGFSASTRDLIIETLRWGSLVDLALSPSDAGRGRPYPDMILTAVLRLGISAVSSVAVIGDTAADMESGRRAGASIVAGVLTGSDDEARLREGGATHVVGSVAVLGDLLGLV
jgi:phosphoglycolate phosphatase